MNKIQEFQDLPLEKLQVIFKKIQKLRRAIEEDIEVFIFKDEGQNKSRCALKATIEQ